MMRTFYLWSLCLIGLMTQQSLAYEQDTHRELSKSSIQQSALAAATNNVLADFGLSADISLLSQQKFPNSKGEMQSIIGLIQDGADFEDNGIRSVQHFYDPVNDKSLQHPLLNIAGGTYRSPDWALADVGAISAQSNSYANANDAFYKALTLPTKGQREQEWGRLFETLGHVVHHIQDMAQPEHVRNDLHCDEVLPCGIPFALIGLFDKSWFEKRSLDVFRGGIPGELINYPAVTFPTAREFWTTRDADGSVSARRGLADFTNRNFVSKDTNFELKSGAVSPNRKYDLPAPIVDPTNRYSLAQLLASEGDGICQALNNNGPIDLPPNAPCEIEFIKTNVTDSYTPAQGGINPKAASLSLFDQYLTKYNVNSVQVGDGDAVHMMDVDRLVTINRFNIDESHKFLIPRAVAYGAGLIDHFFRGKIDMVPNPNGGGWVIKNLTDEDMQGDFVLYYDYAQNVNGDDVITRTPIPGANWAGIYIPAQGETSVAAFSMPVGLINKTLVFDGTIGNERAIASKHFGGWTGPVFIDSSRIGTNISVDDEGNAMTMFWTQENSSATKQLWTQRYTPAGGWVVSQVGLQMSVNDAGLPVVFMDTSGNATAMFYTWTSGTEGEFYTKRYTAAGGWEGEISINQQARYALSVNFASSNNGNLMLTYTAGQWNTAGYDDMYLFTQQYTPATGWGGAIEVHHSLRSYGQGNAFDRPTAAMGENGTALVIGNDQYQYEQYPMINCLSRYYESGSGWNSAVSVDIGSACAISIDNQIGMDANGNAIVVYADNGLPSGEVQIFSKHYSPATGWGAAVPITDYHTRRNVLLGMDAAGNAVVAFKNQDDALAVKHFSPSLGWSSEVVLSQAEPCSPVFPALVAIDLSYSGKAILTGSGCAGAWSYHYSP